MTGDGGTTSSRGTALETPLRPTGGASPKTRSTRMIARASRAVAIGRLWKWTPSTLLVAVAAFAVEEEHGSLG